MLSSALVVNQITGILIAFAALLHSEEARAIARISPGDFTRSGGKLPLHRLLLYTIFRNCKDTNSEVANFYSRIDEFNEQPSRQAVNQRFHHLKSDIWPFLSKKFTHLVYSATAIIQKERGYLVWATDSTSAEMPPSEKAVNKYGIHKHNHSKKESASGKVIVRCGGLYDVINRFFVDYVIKPFKESELSIVLDQLRTFCYLLTKHKIIILADRGYASLQFMAIMQKLGYKFCVRVTRATYRSQVLKMGSNDDYIDIKITKQILSRITDPEAAEYLSNMDVFRVRVVKKMYTNPKSGAIEWMILFTNLSETEFNETGMFELYQKRWNIEVAYYTLKVVLELERHISLDPDVAINLLYGKIAFYNISAIFREQLDAEITYQETLGKESGNVKNKYSYQTNVKALIDQLYASNLIKCFLVETDISEIITALAASLCSRIHKLKTEVRPDRHFERWGTPVTCSYTYRFKIDGRNHQRVAVIGGVLRTTKP